MKASEMMAWYGKRGLVSMNGFRIEVRILDVKSAFGRVDLLVEPIAGSGRCWVSTDRCRVMPAAEVELNGRLAELEAQNINEDPGPGAGLLDPVSWRALNRVINGE